MKYLETGLGLAISQPQSSLQILFSFSPDLCCKGKERKGGWGGKCDHKHTIVKTELKNMQMLLKTISKVLPQHVGECLAPTDQFVTPGKTPSMSANPTALPTVNHQGMELFKTPFSERQAPTVHPPLEAVI